MPYATNNPESTVFDLKRKNITPCKMLRNPLLKFPIYFPTRNVSRQKGQLSLQSKDYPFGRKYNERPNNRVTDPSGVPIGRRALASLLSPGNCPFRDSDEGMGGEGNHYRISLKCNSSRMESGPKLRNINMCSCVYKGVYAWKYVWYSNLSR